MIRRRSKFVIERISPESQFVLFGTPHLVVIGLTAGLPLAFWLMARGPTREPLRRGIRFTLAGLLLVNWLAYEALRVFHGAFNLGQELPMQLCDWATVTVIVALLTDRQIWYELSYFWGLAGTFQAILTPNLQVTFPDPRFISFFVAHCGIVVGVLFLTATVGLRPRAGSLVRVMLWSEVYMAAAMLANGITGENYGFLSHRPRGKSLLDYLSGNHALYLLEMNLLALFFFSLLYFPFWMHDTLRASGVDGKIERKQ